MSKAISLSTGLFEEVRVKLIYPPVRPLRFDLGALDGLINSIKEKGLLHPIVVRPMVESLRLSQVLGDLNPVND